MGVFHFPRRRTGSCQGVLGLLQAAPVVVELRFQQGQRIDCRPRREPLAAKGFEPAQPERSGAVIRLAQQYMDQARLDDAAGPRRQGGCNAFGIGQASDGVVELAVLERHVGVRQEQRPFHPGRVGQNG